MPGAGRSSDEYCRESGVPLYVVSVAEPPDIVGDRGRSKFAKLLMGSVSKEVVQHAGRPVLLVR